MKALFTCGLVTALLEVAVFTASGDTTNTLPLLAPSVTSLFSTNATVSLKPNVYQASPYSCIVIVPKRVDSSMLISPRSTNQFAIRTIQPQPPLRLEPLK